MTNSNCEAATFHIHIRTFFDQIEDFEFHMLGDEKVVFTHMRHWYSGHKEWPDYVALNDIGKNIDEIYRGHNINKYRKGIAIRLAKIAKNEKSAALVVAEFPLLIYNYVKYGEMLKAAIWTDTAYSIIREQLGDAKYSYRPPKNPRKINKLADRIALMTRYADVPLPIGKTYTLKMFSGVGEEYIKIRPDGGWNELKEAKITLAEAMCAKCREIIGDKLLEGIKFLKKHGEVIK